MTHDDIRAAGERARLDTEAHLLRQALSAHGWRLGATAAALRCSPSTLQRTLGRHPELAAMVPGPGRPKSPKRHGK